MQEPIDHHQVILLLSDWIDPIGPANKFLQQHFHSQTQSLLKRYSSNRRYLQQVKQSNGRCLEFFPGLIKSRELAIYAVSQCGSYLSRCSESLRRWDELVISMAVQQDGLALEFVDFNHHCDHHCCQQHDNNINDNHVNFNKETFNCWCEEIRWRRNKEIVMKAVEQNGMALKFILNNDDEVMKMIKQDRQVIRTAILTTPTILIEINQHLNIYESILSDKSFILELIRQNASIFKHLNKKMKSDNEIQQEILSIDGKYLEFFNEDMLPCRDLKLATLAASNSKLSYPFIEKSLRNEIALERNDFTYVEKVAKIQIGDYVLLTSNQIPCQIESIEKEYTSSKCGPSFRINVSGRSLFSQSNTEIPIRMTYFASVSNLSSMVCPFVYRIKCQLMGISPHEKTLLLKQISNEFNVKLIPFDKNSIPESVLLQATHQQGTDSGSNSNDADDVSSIPPSSTVEEIYLEIIQVMGEQKIVSITPTQPSISIME